jgi:hypothetical protein
MKKITLSAMIIVSLLFALVTTIHSASIPDTNQLSGKSFKSRWQRLLGRRIQTLI